MRSRYSAFSLKEVTYLWKTLHADHPDRAVPREQSLREWRAVASAQRFTGLKILDARSADASHPAQVLFFARIFLRGKDLSFVERSDFEMDGEGWRYRAGVLRRAQEITTPLEQLTCENFAR